MCDFIGVNYAISNNQKTLADRKYGTRAVSTETVYGNCKEKNISDIGKKHCSDSYRGISAHIYPDMN